MKDIHKFPRKLGMKNIERTKNYGSFSKDDLDVHQINRIIKQHSQTPKKLGQLNKDRFSKFIDDFGISPGGSRTDNNIDPINDYEIKNPEEKIAIEKLLNTWVNTESTSWTYSMKRIVSIARAILHKPAIILVEENALIIDHSKDLNYLDKVFASLRSSAILCEITSFKLISQFEYCSIFNSNTIVETGKTKELLGDEQSVLVNKLRLVDCRKITVDERKFRRRYSHQGTIIPRTNG